MRKSLKATAAIPTVTAGGEVVPLRGKNEPDLVAEKTIRSAISVAFSDADKSKKLAGSAVQRLAYAVTAQYAVLVHQDKSVAALSEMHTSATSAKELRGELVEMFLGDKPDGEKSHAGATAAQQYGNHSMLLNRAIALAGALAKAGVTLAQWNDTVGNWSVPATCIFPLKVAPLGELGKKMVLLDGRGYGGTTQDKKGNDIFAKVQASVEQFMRVAKPAKVRPGSDGKNDKAFTDAVKAASVDAMANAMTIEKVVAVLKVLFIKDAAANDVITNYTPETRNMLSDIARKYDELKHAADNAKPATK